MVTERSNILLAFSVAFNLFGYFPLSFLSVIGFETPGAIFVATNTILWIICPLFSIRRKNPPNKTLFLVLFIYVYLLSKVVVDMGNNEFNFEIENKYYLQYVGVMVLLPCAISFYCFGRQDLKYLYKFSFGFLLSGLILTIPMGFFNEMGLRGEVNETLDPISMGNFLSCLIILLLTKSGFVRIILLCASSFFILLTASRGPIVGLVCCLIVYLQNESKKSKNLFSYSLLGIFIFFFIYVYNYESLSFLTNRFNIYESDGFYYHEDRRILLYREYFHGIIHGSLLGNHSKIAELGYPHNILLEIGYACGPLILILFLGSCIYLLHRILLVIKFREIKIFAYIFILWSINSLFSGSFLTSHQLLLTLTIFVSIAGEGTHRPWENLSTSSNEKNSVFNSFEIYNKN